MGEYLDGYLSIQISNFESVGSHMEREMDLFLSIDFDRKRKREWFWIMGSIRELRECIVLSHRYHNKRTNMDKS